MKLMLSGKQTRVGVAAGIRHVALKAHPSLAVRCGFDRDLVDLAALSDDPRGAQTGSTCFSCEIFGRAHCPNNSENSFVHITRSCYWVCCAVNSKQ